MNKLLVIMILIVLEMNITILSGNAESLRLENVNSSEEISLSAEQQKIVNVAKQQIGVKFTWGGRNPQTGFDCSGLVQYVFQQAVNVPLGNTVSDQLTAGDEVKPDHLQPGDIVFFNHDSYDGIYIGNGKVIATLGTDKVGMTELKYLGDCSSVRRVIHLNKSSIALNQYHSYKKYVTITQKGYNLYRDKNLAKAVNTSDKLYQMTYLAKGYYNAFDGHRYLSLYDDKGNWVGYIDEQATTLGNHDGSDMGGACLAVKESGVVTSRDYVIWGNFNFDKVKGNTASLNGKTVWVHGKYHCAYGSWYYTIYDKQGGKWLGYVSADAIHLS